MEIVRYVRDELWRLQDQSYRKFFVKLIPTVPQEAVIGVRMPALRTLAKRLSVHRDLDFFLQSLPHKYYEENNLHALVIENIRSYDKCIQALNHFLPYVDNWATCDSMRPKCFGKNRDKLLTEILSWLESDKPYIIRYGLEMLMVWYLDDYFKPEVLEMAATVKSDEYYVNMMQVWFFATALAKQYYATVPYLSDGKLSFWVHNKTVQKAIESNRITIQQKQYLRLLRRLK